MRCYRSPVRTAGAGVAAGTVGIVGATARSAVAPCTGAVTPGTGKGGVSLMPRGSGLSLMFRAVLPAAALAAVAAVGEVAPWTAVAGLCALFTSALTGVPP